MKISTVNNFDLIRLFAASQVAITHAAEHLHYESDWFAWLSLFPGVPIFFFISGFLIYGSYEKSQYDERPLVNFYTKRVLRLYPALWLCFGFSLFLLWSSGYLVSANFDAANFIAWVFTSTTFFQFYNPDFLRGFGVGAINGSLWTIVVELQFYVLAPAVFWLFQRRLTAIISVVVLFIIANVLNTHLNPQETVPDKLSHVSFFPWIYMFLLGAILSKWNWIIDHIRRLHILVPFVAYIASWYVSKEYGLGWGNGINPISYLILVALIVKAAFLKPDLSDKLLKRNDISYGVYIYHMPIVNILLYTGFAGLYGITIALPATVLFSLLSWFLVERPALRLKKHQLRRN